MAKKICIPYNGKKYTLEFTRSTVSAMEKIGFSINELGDKPATMIPMLFSGAFAANHPNTKVATINKIYDGLSNKSGLVKVLTEMYSEAVYTLLSDDEEENEGNPGWEAVQNPNFLPKPAGGGRPLPPLTLTQISSRSYSRTILQSA